MGNQSTSNIKGVIVVVVILVVIIAGYFIYKKLKESPEDKATKKDRKTISDTIEGGKPEDYAGMGADYLSARAAAITAGAKTFDIGDGKTYCTKNGRVVWEKNPCL